MKRRFLALLLSAMMIVGAVTGCGSTGNAGSGNNNTTVNSNTESNKDSSSTDEQESSSMVVSTAYGDVEVPRSPQRICVLDLSTMDIVDTLGLGDKVVCLAWHKHYPSYLEEYYVSETIISLTSNRNNNKGQSEEATTEETTDPYEIYYGIDADLIIGTTDKITEDLYAVLSQIAPTVALEPALESGDDLYSAMRANAATIASIWEMENEFETMITPYDEMYTKLSETVKDKTYVMTSGNTDLNSIQVAFAQEETSSNRDNASTEKNDNSSERTNNSTEKNDASSERTNNSTEKNDASSEKNNGTIENLETSSENNGTSSEKSGKKKNNTANAVTFLTQLGMKNITETVSQDVNSDVISAAVEAGTSQEDAANMVIQGINAVNPDAVVVFNYRYSNLDEIRAEGFDLLGLENLNSKVCFISIELTYTTGGLTAVTSTMEQLAEAFLNN